MNNLNQNIHQWDN